MDKPATAAINQVTAGSWAGGIVGLKSFLGIKNRKKALETMDRLVQLGYIEYELDPKTKKLTYQIRDWVVRCSGEPCMGAEAVYATPEYGFLCLPRDITQRLAEAHYHFDESDAWLDLWCYSVWQDANNAFSHIAPAVQFGKYGAVLPPEALGRRWGWEKTKNLYSQPLNTVWPAFMSPYFVDFPCHPSGCLREISLSDGKNPRPSRIPRL